MKKLNILLKTSVGSRLVSFSYRSRIDSVLIPYQSRIVLLSFSLPEAETIRKRYVNDICSNKGWYVVDTWSIRRDRVPGALTITAKVAGVVSQLTAARKCLPT